MDTKVFKKIDIEETETDREIDDVNDIFTDIEDIAEESIFIIESDDDTDDEKEETDFNNSSLNEEEVDNPADIAFIDID